MAKKQKNAGAAPGGMPTLGGAYVPPPPVQLGNFTPPPVQQGNFTPPPVQQGNFTPPPVQQGNFTPPPAQQGNFTPPPVQQASFAPHIGDPVSGKTKKNKSDRIHTNGEIREAERKKGFIMPIIASLVMAVIIFAAATIVFNPCDYGIKNRFILSICCFLPSIWYSVKFNERYQHHAVEVTGKASRWKEEEWGTNFGHYLVSIIFLAVLLVASGFFFDRNGDPLRFIKPTGFSAAVLGITCIVHFILWNIQRSVYYPNADLQ